MEATKSESAPLAQGIPLQGVPMHQVASTTWHNTVCGCCDDMGVCCDVCWCGWCALGRQWSAVVDHRPDNLNVPVCCGVCVLDMFTRGLSSCIFVMYLRDKIRHMYGIQGSGCEDCLLTCFCGPCVVCQHHKELTDRGMPPGHTCCAPSRPAKIVVVQQGIAAAGPMAGQGYQAPQQGMYQQQAQSPSTDQPPPPATY